MATFIGVVLVTIAVIYTVRWLLSHQHPADPECCLLCGSTVAIDASGGYCCRRCGFDPARAQAQALRPIIGLLRDVREARRSLSVAQRHYDWDRFSEARPYLDEANALLRDLYREMPELIGKAAGDVTGPADATLEKMLGEVPGLGVVVAVGSVLGSHAEPADPADVKSNGLHRLAQWDATLLAARGRLAARLTAAMTGGPPTQTNAASNLPDV